MSTDNATESESKDLVVLGTLTPEKLFESVDTMQGIVEEVEMRAQEIVAEADVNTTKGRALVRSTAFRVTRSKTLLDEMGKDFVSDLKAKVAAVDTIRKIARDRLDETRDRIRKPLDEWEARDAERKEAHEQALALIHRKVNEVIFGPSTTIAKVDAVIEEIREHVTGRSWEEFKKKSEDAWNQAYETLTEFKSAIEAREAEAKRQAEEAKQVEAERKQIEAERAKLQAERAKLEEEKAKVAAASRTLAVDAAKPGGDVAAVSPPPVVEATFVDEPGEVEEVPAPPATVEVTSVSRTAFQDETSASAAFVRWARFMAGKVGGEYGDAKEGRLPGVAGRKLAVLEGQAQAWTEIVTSDAFRKLIEVSGEE